MTTDPKNFNESPGISAEDQMIADMLGGLKRVNAPGDFDIRVRSRIAAGRPVAAGWFGVSPVLRYAGGLLVLVAGATGVSFYLTAPQADQSAETVAAVNAPVVEQPAAISGLNMPENDTREVAMPEVATTGPAGPLEIPNIPVAGKPLFPKEPIPERNLGGSYDEATKRGTALYPLGLDPNSARVPMTANPGANSVNNMIAAADVLSFLGVNLRAGAAALIVGSVRPNSTAARAGLIAGDVIESINGQPVVANMQFSGTFVGRSLVVRRNGSPISINLVQK